MSRCHAALQRWLDSDSQHSARMPRRRIKQLTCIRHIIRQHHVRPASLKSMQFRLRPTTVTRIHYLIRCHRILTRVLCMPCHTGGITGLIIAAANTLLLQAHMQCLHTVINSCRRRVSQLNLSTGPWLPMESINTPLRSLWGRFHTRLVIDANHLLQTAPAELSIMPCRAMLFLLHLQLIPDSRI